LAPGIGVGKFLRPKAQGNKHCECDPCESNDQEFFHTSWFFCDINLKKIIKAAETVLQPSGYNKPDGNQE
jgi:hypothetical protein